MSFYIFVYTEREVATKLDIRVASFEQDLFLQNSKSSVCLAGEL